MVVVFLQSAKAGSNYTAKPEPYFVESDRINFPALSAG
jgi:hypothetical protein